MRGDTDVVTLIGCVIGCFLIIAINCCDMKSQTDYKDDALRKISSGKADEVTATERRALENYIKGN
jgi:hypothetical protein